MITNAGKSASWLIIFSLVISCGRKLVERTTYFPKRNEMIAGAMNKQNVWVFIMAGQSNMAGRGLVEPQDTIAEKRILTIDKNGQLIIAKEPLHFYEPSLAGLDCGYSFGKTMIKYIPDSISVLLIPTAIGGSSISQWLDDALYRNVKLFSNFRSKAEIGKQYGIIKGILWHQGESDANPNDIPHYQQRLSMLFTRFRSTTGNDHLPVLIGELGLFPKDKENRELINKAIKEYSLQDKNTAVIPTSDLKDRGDSLHFNSKGQRTMGRRFAEMYLRKWPAG
ncbi:MAG: sialate O-acetylesterase [Bacteroidota bacterium]|nr:sialate O-acetylesterase [Bacteroidota bacterium]